MGRNKFRSTVRRFQPRIAESLEPRRLMDAQLGSEIASAMVEGANAIDENTGFEEFRQRWTDTAISRNQHLFGQSANQCVVYYGDSFVSFDRLSVRSQNLNVGFMEFASSAQVEVQAEQSSMVADHAVGETNTQVDGIDESDIIETDGNFLYVLSGDQLLIVETNDDAMNIVARTTVDGESARGMYLVGDRLTIVSNDRYDYASNRNETTLNFSNEVSFTTTTYDVSDRHDPTIVEQTTYDGRLVDSRVEDGTLYLMIDHSSVAIPGIQPIPIDGERDPFPGPDSTNSTWRCENEYEPNRQYESESQYRVRLDAYWDQYEFPSFTTLDNDGNLLETGPLTNWARTHVLTSIDDANENASGNWNRPEVSNWYTIATTDISSADETSVGSTSISGDSYLNGVFMSGDAIYAYGHNWNHFENMAEILKFSIDDPASPTYEAKGQVPGHIENQFALDEHGGYLRVTTTDWQANNLFVLNQDSDQLEIVGKIENLAPGEQIYSTRFMGDRAYVVTFRTVDPLFSIDLSDPTNPTVEGELKIPGFSDYLQPIDENHLIGIGRNANEQTGFFQEMQISLFNVADLSNPILVDKFSFDGGRSTDSVGRFDHHAVTYIQSHNTLAIPIHTNRHDFGWWGGINELEDSPVFEDQSQSAVQFFKIDVESGIEKTGEAVHGDRVTRTVYANGTAFTIGSSLIHSFDLASQAVTKQAVIGALARADHFEESVTDGVISLAVLTNDVAAMDAEGPLKIVEANVLNAFVSDIFWRPWIIDDGFLMPSSISGQSNSTEAKISDDGQSILVSVDGSTNIMSPIEIHYTIEDSVGSRSTASAWLTILPADGQPVVVPVDDQFPIPIDGDFPPLLTPPGATDENGNSGREIATIAAPRDIERQPEDVNGDGHLSAIDVLIASNQVDAALRTNRIATAAIPTEQPTNYLPDVNRDGTLSAIDVAIVMNKVNQLLRQQRTSRISSSELSTPTTLESSSVDSVLAAAIDGRLDDDG